MLIELCVNPISKAAWGLPSWDWFFWQINWWCAVFVVKLSDYGKGSERWPHGKDGHTSTNTWKCIILLIFARQAESLYLLW